MKITARSIRKLIRAARQREAAAELLLTHGHHLDAVYLAGYVVGIALKALILRRTPRKSLQKAWEQLTAVGVKGHNYEYLKHLLNQKGCVVPWEINKQFHAVTWWTTDLRYSVGLIKFDEANRFFRAVQTIRSWAERS